MTIRPFTLLELMAVIAIIAITGTLAVSVFRGESPSRKLENAALGFEAYCARVRYAAMENGSDRVVAFNPSTRRFTAEDPEAEEQDARAAVWELPSDFELDSEIGQAETGELGTVEIFRFFADGSASASRDFVMRFRKFQRRFAISPLTGLLSAKEEAAEQ